MERVINHQAMIKARQEHQVALAKKKGQSFAVVQNNQTKKWTEEGRMTKERTAEDGTVHSFEILDRKWKYILLMNKRFLKHNVKNVTFHEEDTDADTVHEEDREADRDTEGQRPNT